MAGSSNFDYDKSNPFFAVEDDVDKAFLKNARTAYSSSTLEERREQLLEERRKIEERTVQSSFRSISLLRESEEIGSATAQELHHQREQLEKTESKLDDINSTLRTSARHIQGIKSVFGSLKNYFSGSKDAPKASSMDKGSEDDSEGPRTRSELSQILEARQESDLKTDVDSHPAFRIRSQNMQSSRDVDEVLDKNLDEISGAISRLKGLGLGLKDELDNQKDLIERVTTKAENVDFRIAQQNKDMSKILKK